MGFPFGAIRPGLSKVAHVDAPARVVVVNATSGRPLLYFVVERCPEAAPK